MLVCVSTLDLSHNSLRGSLDVVTTLTSLTALWMCCNGFSGTFPANVGVMTSLSYLDMGYQTPGVSGTLPASISALTSLR